MNQVINEFLSAILQIVAFSIIPSIFFLFRKNKSESFSNYLGLNRPGKSSIVYSVLASLLFVSSALIVVFLDDGVKTMVLNPPSITGKLREMPLGLISISVLLIIALLKTSLSEEIFFRGFLAKRLVRVMGFKWGNILQALIFGIIHLVLFRQLTKSTTFALAFIFVFSTTAGWVIGFIKEKQGNGSIVPGWIAHGLGNTISYFAIAYVL